MRTNPTVIHSKVSPKQNFFIKTFGCKLNTYDSGFIENEIKKTFFTPSIRNLKLKDLKTNGLFTKPIFILNTCAVTHTATEESVKLVKRLRKENPLAFIVVTGCAAQVNTESFIQLKEMGADLILANSHKNEIGSLIKKELKEKFLNPQSVRTSLYKSNILKQKHLHEKAGYELFHTRSFLKIQDGCSSFCSFCIIPFARGRSRSVAAKNLINKVNDLYEKGIREVVLTGVHIGDYEDETQARKFGLEKLIESLLKETNIPRIRLSSLEPIEVSPFLLDLYKDDRLCPHFHISLQSGDAKILKAMKRKYGPKEIKKCLTEIEKNIKNAFIGMDLITGFPGEEEKEFKNTYFLLKNLPWTRIHVFPYSQRKGTRAYQRTDQVPRFEIKRRSKIMRTLSLDRYEECAKKQRLSIKRVLCFNEKKISTPCPSTASAFDESSFNKKSLLNPSDIKENQKEKKNDFIFQEGISRDYWKVKIHLSSKSVRFIRGKEVRVQVNDIVRKKEASFSSEIALKAALITM